MLNKKRIIAPKVAKSTVNKATKKPVQKVTKKPITKATKNLIQIKKPTAVKSIKSQKKVGVHKKAAQIK